ncbi:MAG: type II toxin-antitoxin system VapC family toxin [Burkholderiales bacterium]|nr:type II toxin-antitoxin system VapC family toxin [Burkholderiales bacterium]
MIIDSSAVLAILFAEADAEVFATAISDADACKMSAATFVELAVVVEAQAKDRGSRQLDAFMRRAGIVIEPVTEEQAHLARQAYSDFGKGRHPAGLNFGDCFSYALAKASGESLLFKGGDFARTDIPSALG